jgi:hypothetical protein
MLGVLPTEPARYAEGHQEVPVMSSQPKLAGNRLGPKRLGIRNDHEHLADFAIVAEPSLSFSSGGELVMSDAAEKVSANSIDKPTSVYFTRRQCHHVRCPCL